MTVEECSLPGYPLTRKGQALLNSSVASSYDRNIVERRIEPAE